MHPGNYLYKSPWPRSGPSWKSPAAFGKRKTIQEGLFKKSAPLIYIGTGKETVCDRGGKRREG